MNRKSRVFAVVLVAVFALAGRQTAAQQGGPSLEKCESLSVDVAEAKEWIIDEDRKIVTLRTRPGPALEAQGREGDSQGRSEEVREARVSFAEGSCNDERVERFLKEIRENTENLHDQDCNRLRALVELVERVDAQVVDGVATLDWDSYDLEIPEHVSLPDELDMELASDVLETDCAS